MERKNINYVGLDLLPVYFNDVSQRSPDVFKITNKPLKFTSGKNLIKFQGNPTALKPGSVLHIEVLDYNRNPIYSEVLNYIDEDKSRVIAIYIYNDTPPGDAKITLCTELASLGGKPVPEFWRNRLNAKWTATIPINPTDPNETEIIFETEPNVKVQEQVAVQLARQYTTTQFPIYSTGLVKYISRNGQPAIELINGTSSADMVGGTITVAAPSNPLPTPAYPVVTTPYSSTIKKVINESLLLLDDEYIVYSSNSLSPQIYNKFDPSSYTISYEATPTYIPTQHSESNAIVEIEELEPGTGDISRIKFYTNNKGTVGTWILSNDIELQPTEIFIANSGSLYPDTSIGKFTSQSIIDTYWTGSTYLGFVESTGPTLTWSTASMINAMSIDSSTDITAYNNVHIVEVSSSFPGTFIGDSSYRVTLDAIGTRSSVSNNADPVLSIYASGSAFKFDSTDVLNQELPIKVGKRIGQLIVTSTSPMFDDVSFQFKSEYTGTGVLLFVVESGAWKIADIRTETDADVGYTPNYTRFRSEIPTTHKSDNQLSFKVEYYNQSGVRSNLISYINDKNWEGGNRYIDGAFSMLTGSLYVADTLESGIDISGLKNTGFIRSLPYGGFNQATGSGSPGFLLFSGSALPNQSATTYEGVGLEMVADANNYFRFRTNPSILDIRTETIFLSGSNVEINTPNFFLGTEGGVYLSGSNGNIAISASNFSVSQEGAITASDALLSGVTYADFFANKQIIITTANSGSYFKYFKNQDAQETPAKYAYGYCVLDLSGETGPFGDGDAAMYVRFHANPVAPIAGIIAPGGTEYDGQIIVETYGPAYDPGVPSCGWGTFGYETMFKYHYIAQTGSYFQVLHNDFGTALTSSLNLTSLGWAQEWLVAGTITENDYFSNPTAATPPPGQPQNDTLGKIRSSRCRITYEEEDWACHSYSYEPFNPASGIADCTTYLNILRGAPGGRYHFAPGDSGWRLQSVSNYSGSASPNYPYGIVLHATNGVYKRVSLNTAGTGLVFNTV